MKFFRKLNAQGAAPLFFAIGVSVILLIPIPYFVTPIIEASRDLFRVKGMMQVVDSMEEIAQVLRRGRDLSIQMGGVCPGGTAAVTPPPGTVSYCLPPDAQRCARNICIDNTMIVSQIENSDLSRAKLLDNVARASRAWLHFYSEILPEAHAQFVDNSARYLPAEPAAGTTNNSATAPACPGNPSCITCGAGGVECVRVRVCPNPDGTGCNVANDNEFVGQRFGFY